MIIYPFFSLITLFGACLNTAYHPHLTFKKYIKIKNRTLAKLLIDKSDPLYIGTSRFGRENKKSNQDKLLMAGLIFYIISLIIVIFSIILTYIIPEIPIPSTEFETDIDAYSLITNTLNKKLTVMISLAFLSIEMIFREINGLKYRLEKSFCKKGLIIVYSLFLLPMACITFYFIFIICNDIITYCF